ncbi:MAG: aminotransferase class IV [Opitutales bacterium]
MSEIVILPAGDKAELVPTASSFAYGYGLFETLRFDAGRLLHWEAHWARLCASARALGICCDYSEAAVLAALRELVHTEGIERGTLKLSLCDTQLFVYARPKFAVPAGPVRVKVELNHPLNERSPLAGHKTHNYAENRYLLETARRAGYYDVLRTNTAGVLAETAVANFFFIRDGILCTPELATGALPGVVRQVLLQQARHANIEIQEGRFGLEVLAEIDAAFMTNASLGLLPVDSIEGVDGVVFDMPSGAHPLVSDLCRMLARVEESASLLR